MLDIYFIIPSIGRKSLKQTIDSLNQLKSKIGMHLLFLMM